MDEIKIHPLQQARKRLGIRQSVLADLTGLSTPTIKRAEAGEPLNAYSISQICEYFTARYGRRVEPEELGLRAQWENMTDKPESIPEASTSSSTAETYEKLTQETRLSNLGTLGVIKPEEPALFHFEERDGCFSFGKLKTTWKSLDGDGVGQYLPQHIRSHYIPLANILPEELQMRREHIERDQEQKQAQGVPFHWNGKIYEVDRFVIGRDAANEDMTLDIWFRPSDYFSFLATNMCLKEPELRERYLSNVDWYSAIPHFSHSFGVSLAVISADGYVLFTQRGKNVGTRPAIYETGVVEGLSRPLDRGTNGEAPDVYRCACRGLAEELGLHEPDDFSVSDIMFLNFGVDTRYSLRGLTGMVKVKISVEKLLARWENGVKDKFENQRLFPIPFTPGDVIAFAYSHQPFAPGPTLYYALVHEFGRKAVENAFDLLAPGFKEI